MKLEALILQCTNIGLIVVLMDRECKFQMLENNTIKIINTIKIEPTSYRETETSLNLQFMGK